MIETIAAQYNYRTLTYNFVSHKNFLPILILQSKGIILKLNTYFLSYIIKKYLNWDAFYIPIRFTMH